MKKLLSIFLALLMVGTLCACGAKKAPADTKTTTETESTTEDPKEVEKREADAAYAEGMNYWFGGNGVNFDRNRALEAFTTAAEKGNADAYYRLGIMKVYSEGADRWPEVSEYFQKAIDGGSVLGYYGQALLYLNGCGVDRDYAKAMELAQKAADGGADIGYVMLGNMYKNGNGVDQDGKKALEYYEKAAESDEWQAKNNGLLCIGVLYEKGVDAGDNSITKDLTKAMEYYQKCIDNGYASAYYEIGGLYDGDDGIENDPAKVFEYAQKYSNTGSYYRLGLCYLYGTGTDVDYAKAMDLFMKDIREGKNQSYDMYAIAWMYAGGKGVAEDKEKAAEWANKCIANGGFEGTGAARSAVILLESFNGNS